MKTITVEVKQDHLETLSKTRKPIIAVAELIWNGLDADATEVRVQFDDNGLGGLDSIRVLDNGHGIRYDDAEAAFSSLGGSWKRGQRRTRQEQRMLHGRLGKGRFRAFSLGEQVAWQTFFELKRPTVKIDPGVLNQVEEYAFAVAKDERFRDTDPAKTGTSEDSCTPGQGLQRHCCTEHLSDRSD